MKRSKFFLSATTCLLAIAAFATAKAHRNPLSICTVGSQHHNVGSNIACSTVNSSNLKTVNSKHITCFSGSVKLVTCTNFKTVYESTVL